MFCDPVVRFQSCRKVPVIKIKNKLRMRLYEHVYASKPKTALIPYNYYMCKKATFYQLTWLAIYRGGFFDV